MQVLRPLLSALAILAAAWALSAQTASAAPGDLTFRGCISARTDTRCHHHANGLSPRDIAVSPDGKSVYVASYGQSTGSDVATFHWNRSTGRLSPRGCIADANSD